MKPKPPTEEQVFIASNNLTYKLRPDLLINKHGRLESTVTELIFLNKKDIICGTIYSMKISNFNNEYLAPLLSKKTSRRKGMPANGRF